MNINKMKRILFLISGVASFNSVISFETTAMIQPTQIVKVKELVEAEYKQPAAKKAGIESLDLLITNGSTINGSDSMIKAAKLLYVTMSNKYIPANVAQSLGNSLASIQPAVASSLHSDILNKIQEFWQEYTAIMDYYWIQNKGAIDDKEHFFTASQVNLSHLQKALSLLDEKQINELSLVERELYLGSVLFIKAIKKLSAYEELMNWLYDSLSVNNEEKSALTSTPPNKIITSALEKVEKTHIRVWLKFNQIARNLIQSKNISSFKEAQKNYIKDLELELNTLRTEGLIKSNEIDNIMRLLTSLKIFKVSQSLQVFATKLALAWQEQRSYYEERFQFNKKFQESVVATAYQISVERLKSLESHNALDCKQQHYIIDDNGRYSLATQDSEHTNLHYRYHGMQYEIQIINQLAASVSNFLLNHLNSPNYQKKGEDRNFIKSLIDEWDLKQEKYTRVTKGSIGNVYWELNSEGIWLLTAIPSKKPEDVAWQTHKFITHISGLGGNAEFYNLRNQLIEILVNLNEFMLPTSDSFSSYIWRSLSLFALNVGQCWLDKSGKFTNFYAINKDASKLFDMQLYEKIWQANKFTKASNYTSQQIREQEKVRYSIMKDWLDEAKKFVGNNYKLLAQEGYPKEEIEKKLKLREKSLKWLLVAQQEWMDFDIREVKDDHMSDEEVMNIVSELHSPTARLKLFDQLIKNSPYAALLLQYYKCFDAFKAPLEKSKELISLNASNEQTKLSSFNKAITAKSQLNKELVQQSEQQKGAIATSTTENENDDSLSKIVVAELAIAQDNFKATANKLANKRTKWNHIIKKLCRLNTTLMDAYLAKSEEIRYYLFVKALGIFEKLENKQNFLNELNKQLEGLQAKLAVSNAGSVSDKKQLTITLQNIQYERGSFMEALARVLQRDDDLVIQAKEEAEIKNFLIFHWLLERLKMIDKEMIKSTQEEQNEKPLIILEKQKILLKEVRNGVKKDIAAIRDKLKEQEPWLQAETKRLGELLEDYQAKRNKYLLAVEEAQKKNKETIQQDKEALLQKDKDNLQKETIELQREVRVLTEQKLKLEEDKNKQLEKVHDQLAALTNSVKEIVAGNQALMADNKDKEETIRSLIEQKTQLTESVKTRGELAQLLTTAQDNDKKLIQFNSTLMDKEYEIKELVIQKDQLTTTIKEKSEQYALLLKENISIREHNTTLQKYNATLQSDKKELEKDKEILHTQVIKLEARQEEKYAEQEAAYKQEIYKLEELRIKDIQRLSTAQETMAEMQKEIGLLKLAVARAEEGEHKAQSPTQKAFNEVVKAMIARGNNPFEFEKQE